MSQVSVNGSTNSPARNPQGNEAVDVLAMLWRWKGLVVLGLLLGLGIGYLIQIQLPPQYTSHAMIQILSPTDNNLPVAQVDLGESALSETRQDEIRIIRGQKVVSNAIRIGKLDQHPDLKEKSFEEVFEWIIDEDRLMMEPGTNEAKTDLIDMEFTCENSELSAEVLQALLSGYEEYLAEAYSKRGQEIERKLNDYLQKFQGDFNLASKEYIKLRSSLPIIWNGEQTRDPYAESFLATRTRINEITMEVNQIDSVLSQVKAGLEAKRPPTVLLDMLQQKRLAQIDQLRYQTALEAIQKSQAFNGESTPLSAILSTIAALQAERDKYSQQYAANHPKVQSLEKEIASMEERRKTLEEQDESRRKDLAADFEKLYNGNQSPEEKLSIAVGSLQEQRVALMSERETLVKMAEEEQRQTKALQGDLAKIEMYKQQADQLETLSSELSQTLSGFNVGSEYNRKKMVVHDVPKPGFLSGPSLLKFLGLGGLLGMGMFAGFAYLLEMADRSYRSPEEIMRSLSVPVLGHIPVFETDRRDLRDDAVDPSVITLQKPQSNASECYRGIRTSLFFSHKKDGAKVIQVTSPLPGDGKSTLATNTAVSLAQSGRRVLFVDCDLRRPRAAKIFGVSEDLGVTSHLLNSVPLEDVIKETSIENLSVITSGERVPNPSELLVLPDFENMLNQLRREYDFVIIDTPPMLSVSDPANVAPLVDAVMLTMRLRRNSRPIAEQAKNILASVSAKIVGVVINGVGSKNNYGYGGYRYDNSGSAGYAYGNKSYGGYGGAEKVYGDEQMQSLAKNRSGRSRRTTASSS